MTTPPEPKRPEQQEPGSAGTLHFEVTFHSPFRISTGNAAPGVHATVDARDPLPASSLKGVMRATATALLGAAPLVAEVFGSPRQPSPWRWTRGVLTADTPAATVPTTAARIRIDPDTHAAAPDMLMLAHELFPPGARFTVEPAGIVHPARRGQHEALLVVAATATHALGAGRRRGLGWVTVRCRELTPTRETVTGVLAHAVPSPPDSPDAPAPPAPSAGASS